MTRAGLTQRGRAVVTICAGAAVLYAAVVPFFYNRLTYAFVDVDSLSTQLVVRTVIVGVPSCLALVGLVVSGRPFVGVAIAVAGAATLAAAEAFHLSREHVPLGATDWMSFVGAAVVGGCALLGADLLVWRRRVDTPALGALAGLLSGLLSAGIVLYEMLVERLFVGIDLFLDRYWVHLVATEALLLVITGLVAGAVAQRWPEARQVTAGSA